MLGVGSVAIGFACQNILQNFLANALRYTKSGGVVLGMRRAGNKVRIEVWDSGPGIPDDQLRSVFEEFRRGSHISPWGEKGLGLGLSICDRMARLLGHRISVRSRAGRGSVFAVELPRAPVQRLPSPPRAVRGESTAFTSDLHALCLDNDPTILEGMSALLTRWGLSCDLAGTIEDAVVAAQRRRPDLLLVDYHLDTEQDGLDALGLLREACSPPPPGALITADTSAELALRARAFGYALLRKPVKPAALRALIAQLGRKIENVQPAA
jgi:CheY-like chemotaxis protein/anti-sigma regulatory factor (Ser/Thr protein kinase)